MKRLALVALLGFAALAILAPAAFAHGGQFNGPGGAVPPGLREPTDPPPPPPPGPTTPPTPTTPPDPTQPPPPPTTPTTPIPPTTGTPLTGDPTQGGHKSASIGYENWTFWFNMNRDSRWPLDRYTTRFTKDSPLGTVGGSEGNKSDATRLTVKQSKELVRPALLWAMDHKNHLNPDIESAAYLALAKLTDSPDDIDLIKSGIYNKDCELVIRESAALALGLLRRSDESRQFDAKEYDKVRDFCFSVFEDDNAPPRTRAFSMFAIGLLGDMKSTRSSASTTPGDNGSNGKNGGGLFYSPDPTAAGMDATSHIVELLHAKYTTPDMPVALLLALSLQPPTSVKDETLGVLRDCTTKGKLWKEEASALTQSYAALTLGRIGTFDYAQSMLTALAAPRMDLNVKRSAAIALGLLGKRVDGAQRATLASDLLKQIEAAKDASVKNFGVISLAYLLEADILAKRTDVLNAKGKVADFLIKLAEDGSSIQRPFGALALAIVGLAITDKPDIKEYGDLRVKAIEVLRAGVEDQKIDRRSRAAFAVGLGIIKDTGSKKHLVALVSEHNEDKELRGYAAVALGMIGEATPDVMKAIKDALKEKSSEELRLQCAVGLGYLGSPDVVELLVKEVKEAESQNVQGQVVVALSKIGDAKAIPPLVDLLKEAAKPDLTRALACAGLGLVGDLELIPSLARIRQDINYRAAPDAVAEVLTIL